MVRCIFILLYILLLFFFLCTYSRYPITVVRVHIRDVSARVHLFDGHDWVSRAEAVASLANALATMMAASGTMDVNALAAAGAVGATAETATSAAALTLTGTSPLRSSPGNDSVSIAQTHVTMAGGGGASLADLPLPSQQHLQQPLLELTPDMTASTTAITSSTVAMGTGTGTDVPPGAINGVTPVPHVVTAFMANGGMANGATGAAGVGGGSANPVGSPTGHVYFTDVMRRGKRKTDRMIELLVPKLGMQADVYGDKDPISFRMKLNVSRFFVNDLVVNSRVKHLLTALRVTGVHRRVETDMVMFELESVRPDLSHPLAEELRIQVCIPIDHLFVLAAPACACRHHSYRHGWSHSCCVVAIFLLLCGNALFFLSWICGCRLMSRPCVCTCTRKP